MEFKPPSAEDARRTLEKIQDPVFTFLISFLVLYVDVAIHFITGKNLLDVTSSDIAKDIPIGKVLVAIPPYFLILYVAPKVHFWLKYISYESHLKWILEKVFPRSWGRHDLIEFSRNSRVINLDHVKSYALRKNEQVLYNFVLSQEERDGVTWKLASICLAFWALVIVEMSCSGLLLNDLFSQHLPKIIGAAYTENIEDTPLRPFLLSVFSRNSSASSRLGLASRSSLKREKERRNASRARKEAETR
jgi:hypothetical protein